MNYKDLSDNELIQLVNEGDKSAIDYILERYKGAVIKLARSISLGSMDTEDLVQEGTIGLVKAVYSYNGKVPFVNYAFTCIKNSIYSAKRRAEGKKKIPKENIIYINEESEFDSEDLLNDGINKNPESEYINNESEKELRDKIGKELSKFENKVLDLYLSGLLMENLAQNLNKTQKSIENALFRIRKKIKQIIDTEGK